jgi:chromosome segregation ATPase
MSDEQTTIPGEVDRIRDIIFGSQMRDYQQQFETARLDLERLQEQIDQVNERLVEQDAEQGKKLQALRRETRQAADSLRDELRQTNGQLANDKVDRVALGELFVQLGQHLTGGGTLTELLEGLVEAEQD